MMVSVRKVLHLLGRSCVMVSVRKVCMMVQEGPDGIC